MQNFSKILFFGLLCFILGAGVIFAFMKYTAAQQENIQLKVQLSATATPSSNLAIATPTSSPLTVPSPAPSEKPAVQTGTITGALGYPSEGIPALDVFAMKKDEPTVFFKTSTKTNQQTFSITGVTPGTYVIFAYPQDSTTFAGGYTKAVPCGLSVECTDHSLIPVEVTTEKTSPDIKVADWYVPEGTFPAKPK